MAKTKKKQNHSNLIVDNRKARFDYAIQDTFEAGVVLQGWEVKALRAGKGQLRDCYVIIKNHEAWLVGSLITPLPTVSTHIVPDPTRTRKLLLHRHQLNKLIGQVERQGMTLIALNMHWAHGHVKCDIALVVGKKEHDKRQTIKNREWAIEKQRLMKVSRE